MKLSCSLVVFLLLSLQGYAQTTILSKSFNALYLGEGDYGPMSGVSGFEGWSFNEYCYAMKDDYAVIGAYKKDPTKNLGIITTSPLGVNGNAVLLIKTAMRNDENAKFRISVVGDGAASSEEYTVNSDEESRPSAILIKGLTPTSKIRVEGTYGKFYLKSLKVTSIGDALFYESFDYMQGVPTGEFYYSSDKIATSTLCDNSNNIVLGEVYQSTKNIFFRHNAEKKKSICELQNMILDSPSDMLLNIRSGHLDEYNSFLSVTCSGDAQIAKSILENSSSYDKSATIEFDADDVAPFTWVDNSFIVKNMSSSTVLTFGGFGANIDEIILRPIPTNLDEKSDNSPFIVYNAGQSRDVTLLRTLTANIWCPLCLPFDVTQTQMEAATGTSCELRTLTSVSEGVFNFDVTTSIAAGTPFLVKTATRVVNPVFTGVTVVSTPAATAAASTADYQFVGTYSPVTLATDGSNLFLGIYGQLYRPEAYEGHDRMNGLRAYFVVPATTSLSRVAISFGGETAGVNGSRRDKAARERLYDLQGRPVKGRMAKGLYVQEGQKVLRP